MKFLNKSITFKIICCITIIASILLNIQKAVYAEESSKEEIIEFLRTGDSAFMNYGFSSNPEIIYDAIISCEGVQSVELNDGKLIINMQPDMDKETLTNNLNKSISDAKPDTTDYLDSFITSFVSFEESSSNTSEDSSGGESQDNESLGSDIANAIGGGFGVVVDGIVGVIFYFFKIPLIIVGWLLMRIIGFAINGVDGAWSGIPLDKILFNQIPILSINFFQATSSGSDAFDSIREQVAIWYVAIRNLSAAILAIMVLYVGIRMAISSVAEEKAKYKRMLADWVVSLVLLFVLHYIMILIININDSIVAILAEANGGTTGESLTIMDSLLVKAMTTIFFTEQLGYVTIYFMLAFMSFIFFATYIKRMVTIAFLIMISPFITITYSIDRMGDGKSQALNTWFKNFVYNILLQPFHCIIYLALVSTAIDSIDVANFTSAIVAIVMVFFMYQAEDIIKDIFHFEGKSVANTIAQAALVGTAIGAISKGVSAKNKVKGYASSNPNPNQNPNPNPNPSTSVSASPSTSTSISASPSTSTSISASPSTSTNVSASPSTSVSASSSPSTIPGPNTTNSKKGALDIAKRILTSAPAKEIGKLPFAIALGAAGLATGNIANAVTGFTAGRKAIEKGFNSYDEKKNLYNFNQDYQSYVGKGEGQQNIYAGQDDNWIRDHAKDLLNGDVEAKDYERDFYNMLLKEKDRYIDSGYSNDDAISQIEQNIAGIQAGKIGQKPKFIGHIPRELLNRFK